MPPFVIAQRTRLSFWLASPCGGLPYYELASGEVVSLSAADIQAIAIDITQAETLMQQGKQECWAAINAAKGQEDIDKALAEYKNLLKEFGAQ